MNIFSLESSFRCVVSGFGKIAMHVLEKLVAVGALPITVSGNLNSTLGTSENSLLVMLLCTCYVIIVTEFLWFHLSFWLRRFSHSADLTNFWKMLVLRSNELSCRKHSNLPFAPFIHFAFYWQLHLHHKLMYWVKDISWSISCLQLY